MIEEDEEDIEKILKRKISWKALLKSILGIILFVGSIFLIQYSQRGESINTTYFILGIMLMCIASSVMVPNPKKKKEVLHTVSILKCEKCGVERVHDYKDGDYVYKDTGIPCEKCDGSYKILCVYSLKLKSKGRTKSSKSRE